MPAWTLKTTGAEAATALQDEIRGKNVLITGVSPRSLGAETVRVIAPYAKTIVIASRTKSKVEEVVAAVKAERPAASLKIVVLDIASIASVKEAAAAINSFGIPIHIVINNAAVTMYPSLNRTKDGFEAQFGADHLALSVRLAVKDAPEFPPRIVVVSSSAHAFDGFIRFDDLNFEKRPQEYDKYLGYAQAKTASILYARLLAKKLAPEGILAFSLHPGSNLQTGLGGATTVEEMHAFGVTDEKGVPYDKDLFKTIASGTSTQIIAAFDPSLKDKAGAYLVDGVPADEQLAEYAKDDVSGEKLWAVSEELLGHKFGI